MKPSEQHTLSTFVVNTYNRLLVDVCSITGVSLDAPCEITYEWTHIEGPLLDKQVLMYLEGRRDSNISFPEWIYPLWTKFINDDDPVTLKGLRQLLVFCYKTEQQPTNEQLTHAQSVFEETDAMCGIWSASYASRHEYDHTLASARRIVGSIIYRINWKEIVPSHGPGAVFPPRVPSEKSRFLTLYKSITNKYPYDQYFCGMPNFWHDCMVKESTGQLNEVETIVAKLTAVPKDSRGPRLISVHPSEAIWIQQGQRQLLEQRISSHPLTRGKINFTDQTVNGSLALLSSSSRDFCTLDLKEASDRISCRLVKELFGSYAYEWMSCSRADSVQLLDGRVIKLEKWAPMGNALCFPVESLVFFSLVVAGIRSQYGQYCTEVYVFGDDIIFPVEYRDGVIRTLVAYGMVPNVDKTFAAGFFRESCGVDAYKGANITPLRLRRGDISSMDDLVSLTDLAFRARLTGYESCAVFLYKQIRRALRERYGIYMPISNSRTCGGFYEYQNIPFTELLLREPRVSYLTKWQRMGVKRWIVVGQQHAVLYGGWYHLQDALLRLERKFHSSNVTSTGPSDRPTEYAVPHRSRLQCGWANCDVT